MLRMLATLKAAKKNAALVLGSRSSQKGREHKPLPFALYVNLCVFLTYFGRSPARKIPCLIFLCSTLGVRLHLADC
jgi:hypothetical protein